MPAITPAAGKSATAKPVSSHVPDAAGRFGPFGGRYVPETLMRALDELVVAYEEAKRDAAFKAELADLFKNYVGRPSPFYHAERFSEQCGGGPDLPEAGRPEPHRRPQDQQHARPGPADDADGQAPCDRGNRRRAAWRGHGHGLCPFRAGLRGLHGRRGHSPPEAERIQHADDGGRGPAGQQRLADPARRDQRGHARLDGLGRNDALHPGLGRRAAPIPA